MHILQSNSSLALWHDVIKDAESSCSIALNQELESYLISLLARYTDQPELAHQLFAKRFLDAMHVEDANERIFRLQGIGDQCLLYAGLFPKAATKKGVNLTYFVDLGRSAYGAVSSSAYDLYWVLAYQFIRLMDVLQSIRSGHDLLPLEAYEQWQTLGSTRARQILQAYSQAKEHIVVAQAPVSEALPLKGKL